MENTIKDIYTAAREILPDSDIDHHETDLYIRVTPASMDLVKNYEFWFNVQRFNATDGSGQWYDIPFAYNPAWAEKIGENAARRGAEWAGLAAGILHNAEIRINSDNQRSEWNKGVTAYALELLESLRQTIRGGYFAPADLKDPAAIEKALLNGAADWDQYSWGGCSLCYDSDIAARLCTPSELKRTRNGERRPNIREEWLDTQARALYQAARRVKRHISDAVKDAQG